MPILSQGFHKGDANNFFAYRVILLVRAVKLAVKHKTHIKLVIFGEIKVVIFGKLVNL